MAWLSSFVSPVILGSASGSYRKAKKALESLHSTPEYKVEGPYVVSVVIPTHNEEKYLPRCLLSLKNQTYTPIEIIVADYASEDKTKEIARSYGAHVVNVLERGVGIARDLGVAFSKGEILFNTDADCFYEHRLIEECVRTLEEGHDVVQVPPTFYDTKNVFLLAGVALRSFKADWQTSGPCIFVWREVFGELNGFLGLPCGEDYIFGLRAKKAGYKIAKRRDLCVASSARRWTGRGSRAPCYPFVKYAEPEKEIENVLRIWNDPSRAMRLESIQGVREPFKGI